MSAFSALAANAKAWPFEQARALLKRIETRGFDGDAVVFETGYGPSGLPHIGTFGEVARTTMVQHAFRVLTDDAYPTRLIAFSDDMDGMRKAPSNVPNQALLEAHMGKPLTAVPDPFGEHEGFAQHNNARLRAFLDGFGFSYEFMSATEQYRSGAFDDMLVRALERYEQIMRVMLPTLGAERQATYSPFLPISPTTGRVLYVPMKDVDAAKGEVTFEDEDGRDVTTSVTGGRVKLQWKPDFGMRWAALGVDFEMYGKDHQANGVIYSKICRILGVEPPVQYVYELFLDANGEKISKSKGNGVSIEEWLTYAAPESLAFFMFQKPKTAKRMHFEVIPKATDEYLQHRAAFAGQEPAAQIENPTWHVHAGPPPADTSPISFSLLLNLASAVSAHDTDVLWGFIGQHVDGATPQSHPLLDRLAGYAVRYFQDVVAPTKSYRAPDSQERGALEALRARLAALDPETRDGEVIQTEVYAVGKEAGFEPLRSWFVAIYEVLLGQTQGPRFGSFAAVYGLENTIGLIDTALAGDLVAAPS